jgi:hypothetical protein
MVWILVIFYSVIMHENEFDQVYSRYLLKRIHTKFTLHFKTFMQFSMYFEGFLLFSGNYLINPERKRIYSAMGRIWPIGLSCSRPVAQPGHAAQRPEVARLAWCVVRRDAVAQGDAVAQTGQWLENRCGTGEVPGKVFGGGAQRTRVVTLRWRRCLVPTALRQRRWPPTVGEAPPRSCGFIEGEEGEVDGGGGDGRR